MLGINVDNNMIGVNVYNNVLGVNVDNNMLGAFLKYFITIIRHVRRNHELPL